MCVAKRYLFPIRLYKPLDHRRKAKALSETQAIQCGPRANDGVDQKRGDIPVRMEGFHFAGDPNHRKLDPDRVDKLHSVRMSNFEWGGVGAW